MRSGPRAPSSSCQIWAGTSPSRPEHLRGGERMNSDRRRGAALIVLCTGMLMIVLDLPVVNAAVSALRDDLGFDEASLAWVVNAYMIACGGRLVLADRLGALLGRRRVFLSGL